MDSISAVIITHNEARNIGRCLDSLQGVVDEIVVVDSGSTDETQQICEEKGARFIPHSWAGYSGQKNFANAQATHAYIYSIDADEALSPELKTALLNAKSKGLSGVYEHNRMTNYCGHWVKHLGWYPDRKVRLFPKAGTSWEGDIHEVLTFGGNPTTHTLTGDLYHYSYYDEKDHRTRADKYSALTAKKLFEQGRKASVLRPFISMIGRFVSMYVLKLGFLDGKAGYRISVISALSNRFKYQELNRLHREGGTA